MSGGGAETHTLTAFLNLFPKIPTVVALTLELGSEYSTVQTWINTENSTDGNQGELLHQAEAYQKKPRKLQGNAICRGLKKKPTWFLFFLNKDSFHPGLQKQQVLIFLVFSDLLRDLSIFSPTEHWAHVKEDPQKFVDWTSLGRCFTAMLKDASVTAGWLPANSQIRIPSTGSVEVSQRNHCQNLFNTDETVLFF